jgi:hypothetical protein
MEVAGILTPLFFFDATELKESEIVLHEATIAECLQTLVLCCTEHREWTVISKNTSQISVKLSACLLENRLVEPLGFLIAAITIKKTFNSPETTAGLIHAVISDLPIQFCLLNAAGTILAGNKPWFNPTKSKYWTLLHSNWLLGNLR